MRTVTYCTENKWTPVSADAAAGLGLHFRAALNDAQWQAAAKMGWSYLSCNLVRLGAKNPYTTSTCDSRQCAAGRFAQLLDFIELLEVWRVNWRKKYDYPRLHTAVPLGV